MCLYKFTLVDLYWILFYFTFFVLLSLPFLVFYFSSASDLLLSGGVTEPVAFSLAGAHGDGLNRAALAVRKRGYCAVRRRCGAASSIKRNFPIMTSKAISISSVILS